MLLPLIPFALATLGAVVWLALLRRGQPTVARRFGLGANVALLLVVLVLPASTATVPAGRLYHGLSLAWDHATRLEGAVLMLASLAHLANPREERRVVPETLLVAMVLLCLATRDALAAALAVGLLDIVILWVEGSLPAGSRGPFAVFGVLGVLGALAALALAAVLSLPANASAAPPYGAILTAAFTLGLGGVLLGYPALRWPTMASLTVTAAHLLRTLGGGAALSPRVATPLLVLGTLIVLFAGVSTALWGSRGRALDALYGLAFGQALLAGVLYAGEGAGAATLALLGAVVAYAALVVLERVEESGAYQLPRIVAVASLAGLAPGGVAVARWQDLAATLALGDGWLAFWQVLGAALACATAAVLLMPWLRQTTRSQPPNDWLAWGLGAALSALGLVLGVVPGIAGSGLPLFGAPAQWVVVSLVLLLLPIIVGFVLALSPAALRANRRANRWRESVRPVWQGAWEGAALALDHAFGVAAEGLYRLFGLLEERLIILWGLLWVVVMLLVALESGL